MAQTESSRTDGFQAELVASLLFRYPEICSLKIQPRQGTITLTFLPKGTINQKNWASFTAKLQESLEAYHQLELCPMIHLYISCHNVDSYSLIEVTRDLATLQREEFSLIVTMVREFCLNELIVESFDLVLSRDLEWQDELIDHMLEDVRATKKCQDIVAFREAGRVVVFNRGKMTRPRERQRN